MENKYFVHTTSIVDDGASIGEGTSIWHFSHVMPKTFIGKKCNIGQNCFIDNNVMIGDGVKIQNNVSVYNGVILEDGVFVGPSVVFTNVINPRSFIERKTEFKKTVLKKGSTIGANATIVCGIEIGEYALIGAGTVVNKDIPAFALMVGNPARQIGWMSERGIKLKFNNQGEGVCSESGDKYILKDNRVTKAE